MSSIGATQDIALVEAPALLTSKTPILRSAGLERSAIRVWQGHKRVLPDAFQLTVGGHNGFWGREVTLAFSVASGGIRTVTASGAWWRDFGPPLAGSLLDLCGRVFVTTTKIDSGGLLGVSFTLTGTQDGERVTVDGEATIDLFEDVGDEVFAPQHFGTSIAFQGSLAAIAAVDGVHVYQRINGHWQLRTVLRVNGAVAISGESLAVHSRCLTDTVASTQVHVYSIHDFSSESVLDLPSIAEGCMAFDGGNLLVAQTAYGNDRQTGSVLAYRLEDNAWKLVQQIQCPDSDSEYFGESLAVDGNIALISRLTEQPSFEWTGNVFVFEYVNGSWHLAGQLPPVGAVLDNYGHDVDIDDGIAVVGAPHGSGFDDGSGSVYLYRRGELSWETPDHFAESAPNSFVGWAVAAEAGPGVGPIVVTSSLRNEVRVFTRVEDKWDTALVRESGDLADTDGFGTTVAVSGSTILVGAPEYKTQPETPASGAVFVYDLVNGEWRLTAQLAPSR